MRFCRPEVPAGQEIGRLGKIEASSGRRLLVYCTVYHCTSYYTSCCNERVKNNPVCTTIKDYHIMPVPSFYNNYDDSLAPSAFLPTFFAVEQLLSPRQTLELHSTSPIIPNYQSLCSKDNRVRVKNININLASRHELNISCVHFSPFPPLLNSMIEQSSNLCEPSKPTICKFCGNFLCFL